MAWYSLNRPSADNDSDGDDPPLLNGRYRLGARLGDGASSQVREAVDLRTGGVVAVKQISLPPKLSPSLRKEWVDRLRREAQLARRLEHPDIIAIFEAGIRDGEAWLAMAFHRAMPLRPVRINDH